MRSRRVPILVGLVLMIVTAQGGASAQSGDEAAPRARARGTDVPRLRRAVPAGPSRSSGSASLPRRASPPTRTVADLLRGERDALRRILENRRELRRVRLGRRAAQGELLRLDTVHLELERLERGLLADRRKREAKLRHRTIALYRLVRHSARRPLLDPRRGLAAVDGRRQMLRILGRDLEELKRIRREEARVVSGLADVVQRRREAVAVLADLDRRKDLLQARHAHDRQELSELGHLRETHKGQASEWNGEAFGLEREIVALRLLVQQEVPSFARQRGSLVRPVPGMIMTWFGDRSVKGTKTTEEVRGVEISALPSWKVRAPAEGTVRFAGPVPGFGQVIVLDHDEGYLSVLGHLGALLVRVGDRVKGAQAVASLGAPSRGRRPRVYLELRSAGRAFDPVPWIQGGLAERAKRGPASAKRGASSSPGATPEVVERDEE